MYILVLIVLVIAPGHPPKQVKTEYQFSNRSSCEAMVKTLTRISAHQFKYSCQPVI